MLALHPFKEQVKSRAPENNCYTASTQRLSLCYVVYMQQYKNRNTMPSVLEEYAKRSDRLCLDSITLLTYNLQP